MLLNQTIRLVQKEFLTEWRRKSVIGGMLLYVLSTVFICYLSIKKVVDLPTWNALFWIIQVFIGVNGIARSFLQESRGKLLYLYTIADPRSVILSKMLYGTGMMIALSTVNLICYSAFVGNPVKDMPMYLSALLAGSFGFASVITMVSAIASKASDNAGLVAILGFPVLLPLLQATIRFSKNAMDDLGWEVNYKFMAVLLGLNVLSVALGYLLFPYLWKD
ncbi:MAG: heme exporter protein CcmB [Bacteroidota bacterium]